jgi:aspartate--ammonia ligase
MTLYKYGYEKGSGIYTDMNAIRRDEDLSPIHSYYVDQWDWEKVIDKSDRTVETLKATVSSIYSAIKRLQKHININYRCLSSELPEQITFLTTQ